jgi:hypothetical protein
MERNSLPVGGWSFGPVLYGRRRGRGRQRDRSGEREIFRKVAEYFGGSLSAAFERVDLREGLLESDVTGGLARPGGVDELLLGGESRLELALVGAGGKPGVNSKRGDDERNYEGDDFYDAAHGGLLNESRGRVDGGAKSTCAGRAAQREALGRHLFVSGFEVRPQRRV